MQRVSNEKIYEACELVEKLWRAGLSVERAIELAKIDKGLN